MQKWGCVMQAVVCKSGVVLCRLQYVKVGCVMQAVVCKSGLFYAGRSM